MLKVFVFIILIACSSLAQKKTYPSCKSNEGRVDLEGFCPRVEGVTLPKCCPPLEKKPGVVCNYQIIKDRGQAVLSNSTYQVCEGGVQKQYPCCRISQRACYTNPVSLNFVSRLIHRDNSCCFETCPPASYWRAQPNPISSITSEHELVSSPVPVCLNQVVQECSYGSNSNCPADSFCPPPEVPTTPTPPPTGTTTPTVPYTPDPGPSNPDPTPTNPDPGPTNPSPPPGVGGYDE